MGLQEEELKPLGDKKMPERRKDPKGRVLKQGEGFRKSDNLYSFRYKNVRGKVKAFMIRI